MPDVGFKRVDVIIASLGWAPDRPADVLVAWELVRQNSLIEQIQFDIERSLSPAFDDVEVIATVDGTVGQHVYLYHDITPNLISLWRRYFYRIKATLTGNVFRSKGKTWETNPRPHEIALIEDHDFLLRFYAGQPSFGFIERTADAPQCSRCYNPTTGRVEVSNCTLCLGTGRERPYFDPIPMFVDFNPDQKQIKITTFGETEPHAKVCWFSAYPILKPADIIYQILPGLLWRINAVDTVQPQGTTIQQMASLSVIDQTNVEYKRLPAQIPQDQLLALVQEWEKNKREREF